MPNPIDSLTAGQWYEVANSDMYQATLPFPPNVFNVGNIMDPWGGGAYDTVNDRLVVWGGGHGDSADNGLYAFSLATLTWSRLTTPYYPTPTEVYYYDDPTNVLPAPLQPASRHTYSSLQFVPGNNSFYCMGAAGGWGPTGNDTPPYVDRYSFTDHVWHTKLVNMGNGQLFSVYDTNTQAIWAGRGVLTRFDLATNTLGKQTVFDNYLQTVSWYIVLAFDPDHNQIVGIGAGDNIVRRWDISNLAVSIPPITQATTGDTTPVSWQAPGFCWDPIGHQFVAWFGGQDVYTLNPVTWVWVKQIPANSVVPTTHNVNGTYGRWQYSPAHNVFVGVNTIHDNVFIYKLSNTAPPPPDTTPPSMPTGLTANAVSSSQINLAWNASTDNVGVTGYKIYRGGVQIATSSVTSYSNTGLSSSTTYTYTVAAYDAAGNTSAQSGPASATTGAAGDTTPPSVPTGLTAFVFSASQINLSWNASTDNVGVAGYKVFRGGVQIATVAALSYQDTGLLPSTTYSYTVSAFDTAGNNSAQSGAVSATTLSATPGQITSFTLTSTQTGKLPFTIGLFFKKSDITGLVGLDIAEYQVSVKRHWNNGSVKHAIVSGQTNLTAGSAATINVSNAVSNPTGINLTATHIQAANPSAVVQLGAIGQVSLGTLLGSPFRTWVSGPEMVECHYRQSVDASLSVWFHVRLYKAGRIWIRAIVENGYVGVSVNKSYVPTVTISSNIIYNNSGLALSHYANTRWSVEGWIGGDPAITPKHNLQYMYDSRLVPNYWKHNPSSTILNALVQSHVPMASGNLTPHMGDAGYQDDIGLLPLWDALYCSSGHPQAYRSCLANSSDLNSYPVCWRIQATQLVVKPSDNPVALNAYGWAAGNLVWEFNHHPSEGYLAYLITGDYWHYETMLMNTAMSFMLLNNVSGRGAGTSCLLVGETRGDGWALRTLSQYCGVFPDSDPIGTDYQALLAYNINHWKAVRDTAVAAGSALGYLWEYNPDLYGPGIIAPWQQHFGIQGIGMGSDIECLPDMTNYLLVRNYLYYASVGIGGDASTYCFCQAGASYNLKSNPGGVGQDVTLWYYNWTDVFNATVAAGLIPGGCGNTLLGASGGDPSDAEHGYWGNWLPSLSYAVDHGAPGAAASWARLQGASNFSTLENAGFDDIPTWGIVPRGAAPPPPSPPSAPTGLHVVLL